jgi:tetratricopeptide (TPR) repeat protein
MVFDLGSWAIFAAVLLTVLSLSAYAMADDMTASDWFLVGEDLLEAGSYEDAAAAYDEAISMDPENGTLHLSKGDALYALARSQGSDSRILEEAIAAYDEAIRLDPASAMARLGKGRALSLASNALVGDERVSGKNEALSAVEMATELDPVFFDAWVLRGNLLDELAALTGDLSRYNQSLSAYERAIDLAPFGDARSLALAWDGKAAALSTLANGLAAAGDSEGAAELYERAVAAYDEAIELDPDFAGLEARLNRASVLAGLGRYERSIEAYDQAAEAAPGDLKAYVSLVFVEKAAVLLEMGEEELALESLDAATLADPGNAAAWTRKGDLLSALGRGSEAEAARARARGVEEKG